MSTKNVLLSGVIASAVGLSALAAVARAEPTGTKKAKSGKSQPNKASSGASGGKAPALTFRMKDIDGKEQDLRQYRGKVVLMVNVASQCGLTPQYKALEALYEKEKDRGLVVLGFPANNFGAQEPGSDSEIKQFCSTRFHVTFPMFSKVSVKGDDTCKLYKYLTSASAGHKFGGDVKWNFTKFLVNRRGELVDRFEPPVKPDDPKLLKAVAAALDEPPSGDSAKSAKSTSGHRPKS